MKEKEEEELFNCTAIYKKKENYLHFVEQSLKAKMMVFWKNQ